MSFRGNGSGTARHKNQKISKGGTPAANPAPRPGVIARLRTYICNKISTLGPRAWAFSYGLFCFCLLGLRAVIEGSIIKRPRAKFWRDLAAERNRLWDLSKPPSHELKHAFFELKNGSKLHYLTSNLDYVKDGSGQVHTEIRSRSNLVVLLHGWPDTGLLWNEVIGRLPASLKEDSTLVAVDLPGFGGSDGLAKYGPEEVMPPLFDFIVGMRALYLDESDVISTGSSSKVSKHNPKNGKVIIVAHDWGAICGFKLAAQAPQLADRFILINSVLPPLSKQNIKQRWERTCKLYQVTGIWTPWKTLAPLRPVVRQIGLSVYVFIFNLPMTLAKMSMSKCNLWSLRLVSSIAVGYQGIKHVPRVVSHMAGFMGPTMQTVDTRTPDGQGYGDTVHKRARNDISTETIRLYRDGLAPRYWEPRDDQALTLHRLDMHNRETRKRFVGTHLQKVPPAGKLWAKTTVVFGELDPALELGLATEGMADYFTEGSQVVQLPTVGHWVPIEGEGPAAVAAVVEWALEDESAKTLAGRVQRGCPSAKMTLTQ